MNTRSFPAAASPLVVPATNRRTARAGMAMYAPCRRRSIAVRDLLWWGVGVFGPGVLRTPHVDWPLPVGRDTWRAIADRLRTVVEHWDAWAVYRRAAERPGATIALIDNGRQAAVVKIEPEEGTSLATEIMALGLVSAHGPSTFAVPRVWDAGTCAGWRWAVLTPMELGRHRMAVRAPVKAVAEEVGVALGVLHPTVDTPAHWRPIHGDFVPWNLRTTRAGPLALLDWESVGWAPPGADLALYDLSARAVGRDAGLRWTASDEVVRFWQAAIAARVDGARRQAARPDPLNLRILTFLERHQSLETS